MKFKILFIILFCWCLLNTTKIFPDNIDDAISKTESELLKSKNKNSALIDKFAADRKNYTVRLDKLRSQILELKNELSKLSSENIEKDRILNDLKKDATLKNYEVLKFKKQVKSSAESLYSELQNSLITAEDLNSIEKIESLLKNNRYPDYEYLRAFFDICLKEIEKSGEIKLFSSNVFDRTGNKKKVAAIRFGKIALFYKTLADQQIGFAGYSAISKYLYDIPFDYGWKINSDIKNIFDIAEKKSDKTICLPADLTGGKLIEQYKIKKNIWETIKSGGFIMIPILLIGILGGIIIIHKYFFLRKIIYQTDESNKKITELLNNKNWDEAERYCNSNKNIMSGIFAAAICGKSQKKEIIENMLREKILAELPHIEKYMSTLNIFAAIAPLLGLLGTVTGMISTFDAITVFGSGNPKLMSSGISEALITTEYGLIVSIPILFFTSVLSDKIEVIINLFEKYTSNFINNYCDIII
ncbi:MotA/TolQ/ExbB proton channel family protein [Candidatus Dependentiae bacterium]|nr:MotA/TolQ/ExbB proton channel family protein [Candidatus Dependentiae bacterium]